ncbi:MAG: hypothetical protein U5L08_06925 [Xanthomonadales bacterium]|nr:hypothetical protein [Xanthomonadales bacterium]
MNTDEKKREEVNGVPAKCESPALKDQVVFDLYLCASVFICGRFYIKDWNNSL